jgi:hypothetical protein
MEAVMPLIYLPLIIYAGWLDCLFQPVEKSTPPNEPE